MIKNGGFPYKVYSMLYNACVTSVADYSAPVTGYLQYDSTLQLQLRQSGRAMRGTVFSVTNTSLVT